MLTSRHRVLAFAAIMASSAATGALAQEATTDPSQPETAQTETMPPMGGADAMEQAPGTQPEQSNTMADSMMSGPASRPAVGQGMMCSGMCSGMMGQGATCSEMCSGMMGGTGQGSTGQDTMGQGTMSHGMGDQGAMGEAMHGPMGSGMHEPMMTIMFAITDVDGNGGLSLDELAAIQGRVFGAVDANGDGSVTPEELQAFVGR